MVAKIRSFKPKQFKKFGLAGGNMEQGVKTSAPTPLAQIQERVITDPKQTGKFVRLVSLGGVGNVTKNMYLYEYADDIVIIDCGVGFPEEEMLGVDLVIPDVSYLKDKKHKIRGIVVSHGHEDHIGGLPYIWPELDVPIYSQKLTCGLIRAKFNEHKLPKDKIKVLGIDDTIKLGSFEISFYRVSHSIPDATGIVMHTPIGTIVHQSDFKMDWTPVNGQTTDVAKLAKIGTGGVLFMTIDSLRVEKEGFNPTELNIEETFERIEKKSRGRMFVTMTSSNITRIQQVINVAVESGRKMALVGRSMETAFQVARDLGYLNVPGGLIIAQDEIRRIADNKLIVLIAGSQGQPESALYRIATHDHKFIQLKPTDTIVVSADPIPLSQMNQLAMLDVFAKQGIDVYWSVVERNLHVGGHATRDEIKMMINLAKPKYILPIGGTYRHMWAFAKMAEEMGYKKEQIILNKDGDVVEIGRNQAKVNGRVEVYNVYIDGLGIGDVGSVVLRDRQTMAEEGVVVVMIPLSKSTEKVAGQPEIISRGFVFEKTSEDLLDAALEIVKGCLAEDKGGIIDWRSTRRNIEDNLEKFFYQEIKRRPLILPVVLEL